MGAPCRREVARCRRSSLTCVGCRAASPTARSSWEPARCGSRSPRAADLAHGGRIFVQTCASCHGADGQGQRNPGGAAYQFPPLWGPDSFNNGAGMSRLLTAAAYAMHNMPLGITFDMPVLTDEEAYDVAGYLVSRERPDKANLDKDF